MTLEVPGDGPVNLRKPVEALVMVPRTGKLSPLGRKMYNVLLYVSQMTMRTMQGIPPATYLFSAPLFDVLRICDAPTQQSAAKRYLAEMRRTDVVWDSPDSNSELQQVGFTLLPESRITQKSGGAIFVHWALPPTLYESLADPARWATIDLVMLSRLNNYASIVLYEICSKYQNNPSKLTCKREIDWWMEVLSASHAQVDPVTGKRKGREWRKYKNAVVNSAIAEVNAKTEFTIEMLETKGSGRAIEFVQFRLTHKSKREKLPGAEKDGQQNTDVPEKIVAYARQLGVTEESELAKSAGVLGEAAVIDALRALERRQSQLELPLIASPTGYFRFLVNKNQAQPVNGKVIDQDEGPKKKRSSAPSPEQVGDGDNQEGEDSWAQAQRDEVLKALKSMPKEEISRWLEAYAVAMRAEGMLTPAIKKRLQSDDWCVGVVKMGMIQFYGRAMGGEGWLTPPESLESA